MSTADQARTEIVFLDTGVDDANILLDNLAANNESQLTQVYLLDSSRDGITYIAEVLAGYKQVDAVHILSHAAAGQIQLGNTTLTTANLDAKAETLAEWGQVLTGTGDILIYGCNLTSTAEGEQLVEALAGLTNADVAASDDLTGNTGSGGNWDLEYTVGDIETDIAMSASAQQAFSGTLAVTTFQQDVSGYTHTQDSYIDQGSPTDTSLGTKDDLTTYNNQRQALVRFDNIFVSQGGSVPDNAIINSATLTIKVSGTTNSADISIHRMLTNWTETSTWNDFSAGGAGIQLDGSEAVSTADDWVDGGNGTALFDVTSSLNQWSLWGASNFGWVLDSDDNSDWKGISSEKSTVGVPAVADRRLHAGRSFRHQQQRYHQRRRQHRHNPSRW